VAHHNTIAGIFFSRNMQDSIARNNHVYNTTSGIIVAESPNNQIYDNIIEGATSQGIRLYNPEVPDDGFTEDNLVYDNTIIDSENAIRAIRSNNNFIQNITFSDIESSEYRLSGNSSIVIRGQDFDNALITAVEDDSETGSRVEIVDSGTIEVVEVNGDSDDDEEEGNNYNTDNTPYRKRLSDGDSIIVNSENLFF
jgi:nitrous oxidase accessory protein NosD